MDFFQGYVTSVPKNPFDFVPIRIVCHKMILHGEKEFEDVEAFKCLWKYAIHEVESTKNHPPGITKYQKNFCLVIHEVIRSNPHLFTDEEKKFMGIKSKFVWVFISYAPFEPSFLLTDYDYFICDLFTESFTSLSNDSQRLFVRLYTRKGFLISRYAFLMY